MGSTIKNIVFSRKARFLIDTQNISINPEYEHNTGPYLQGNWRHAVTNRPVSREELMMVLAGLVGLRIRGLYFTQSQRLSLGEVGLEGATNTGTGGPGNTVEDCSCPPQYTGDSCEVRRLNAIRYPSTYFL